MSSESGELEIIEEELSKTKKLYNTVNRNCLPDGGAKLRNKIDDLETKLKQLSIVSQTPRNNETKSLNSNPKSAPHDNQDKVKLNGKSSTGSSDGVHKSEKSLDEPKKNKGADQTNYVSFADLKSKFDSSGDISAFKKTFPQSPSFTSYRSHGLATKLIDAKFLPPHLLNKKSNAPGSNIQSSVPSAGLSQAKTEAIENIHTSLKCCPDDDEEASEPDGLETNLLKHQKKALTWLTWRETQQPCGGIFADDMGLGKTLTMIALILKCPLIEDSVSSPHSKGTLVVCLASIIHQWHNEILRHCKKNALNVLVYHGGKRTISCEKMKEFDVVITTYNLILNEGKSVHLKKSDSPLFAIKWYRIILDEAHTIKNYKSQTAEYVFKLVSKIRWAMTGTPIHNDLKDMYCLLKYLQCKPFDNYNVWKKLINDFSNNSIERRNALVKSILLRRCKDQKDQSGNCLIYLPKKSTVIHKIVLGEVERAIYEVIFDQFKAKVGKFLVQSSSPRKNSLNGSALLTLLLKLQQCCNHPSLMKTPTEENDSTTDSFTDVLDKFASLDIDNTSNSNISKTEDSLSKLDISFSGISHELPKNEPSAKIDKLLQEVKQIIPQNEKIVIVSQWVSMLDIISLHLKEKSLTFQIIKGSTKAEDRNKIAEDFNTNPEGIPILLLSLKAGGVGLNLVGGNHMFLLDLHWNPALELQATDRIYRVGQKRDVCIHKFVCTDTIEEKIITMQEQKKHLATNVLNSAKELNKNLTMDDLRELFEC